MRLCFFFIISVMLSSGFFFIIFFFFNDTATTEIYTLSLHDALPISRPAARRRRAAPRCYSGRGDRSEEHTSELQSLRHLVCRLLLEKKKKIKSQEYNIQKKKKKITKYKRYI